MKINLFSLSVLACMTLPLAIHAEDIGQIHREIGMEQPTWVSMSGFTGEAASIIQFDLYVQGFNFTNNEGAQYLISGGNNGNLEGRVMDRFQKRTIVSKAYSGASIQREVHA